MPGFTLRLEPERFAVCRLAPTDAIPPLPLRSSLVSVTLTADELSLVVPESFAPDHARTEGGWRALRVEGVLDFSLTGVLASLANPLAQAGVSIFAVSTFDTDYVLVKDATLELALATLRAAEFTIVDVPR